MVEARSNGGDAMPVWRNDIGESEVTIQSKGRIYVPIPILKLAVWMLTLMGCLFSQGTH